MVKKTFKIRGNLAEALDDTVSSAKNNAGELHVEIIPLRKIELDVDNPRDLALAFEDIYNGIKKNDALLERKLAEKEALSSIISSIETQGVINPIIVYKVGDMYRLIAGERRTLASLLAGKEDIPARILTTKPNQLKLSLIQWIENIEREDLSLWERLKNLEKILVAYAEANQVTFAEVAPKQISDLLGCSLQQGVNYRHLLNSSKTLRAYIQSNEIKNIEKAALIAKSSEEQQEMLLEACLNGATLSELKKLSTTFAKPVTATSEKGIPSSKINLGSTKNHNVAKIIIESVIRHEQFQYLHPKFQDVMWNDRKSIAQALKQLIKALEKA